MPEGMPGPANAALDACPGVAVDTKGTVGVLIANTGSPAAPEPDAVRTYLAQFLMDAHIRPLPALPWWLILQLFILPARKNASAKKYRLIWREEGSPLIVEAERLARRVEERLATRGSAGAAPVVRAGMSYGEPSIASALRELRAAGAERLVVVPLYPQSAFSITQVVLAEVRRSCDRIGWHPPCQVVERYGDDARYLDAIAAQVRSAGFDAGEDRLMFSFHSVPMPDIERGDTYPEQVAATCRAVAARLGVPEGSWSVSFQSPFEDARTWRGPFTLDLVADAAAIPRRTFIICPGFSLDCLETLYDVGIEYQQLFWSRAVPGAELVYVPCLNAGADAAALVAGLVEERVAAWTGDRAD